jgi:hypothetical protein
VSKDRRQPVVLNLVPRVGDELFAIPVALRSLSEYDWKVVNVLVDIGASSKQRKEMSLQAERAALALDAFMLQLQKPLVLPVFPGDLELKPSGIFQVRGVVMDSLNSIHPEIIVAPSPQDQEPGRALIGRAVQQSIEEYAKQQEQAPTWWMWSADTGVTRPSLALDYDEQEAGVLQAAAREYKGRAEGLAELLNSRARLLRLALEGFDLGGQSRYAEAWMELHLCQDLTWRAGPKRLLDLNHPLVDQVVGNDMRGWLQSDIPEQAAALITE